MPRTAPTQAIRHPQTTPNKEEATMSARHLTPADYIASPRSTDPGELLAESQIRGRFLRRLLDGADAEIERLEGEVNHAYREIAGLT
jgi:hypothetical protein